MEIRPFFVRPCHMPNLPTISPFPPVNIRAHGPQAWIPVLVMSHVVFSTLHQGRGVCEVITLISESSYRNHGRPKANGSPSAEQGGLLPSPPLPPLSLTPDLLPPAPAAPPARISLSRSTVAPVSSPALPTFVWLLSGRAVAILSHYSRSDSNYGHNHLLLRAVLQSGGRSPPNSRSNAQTPTDLSATTLSREGGRCT